MSTTRKKRVMNRATRFTKRKKNRRHKVKKSTYSSYFSRCLGLCVKSDCISIYPSDTDSCTDIIPDIYFKDLADELLLRLQDLFMKGSLWQSHTDAYDAMMLGYACLLESNYKDAVAFLNKGLDMV